MNGHVSLDGGRRDSGLGAVLRARPQALLLVAAACALLAGTGRRGAARRSKRARRAPSPVDDVFNYVTAEQPLILAGLGLAAGAALGACLPGTKFENKAFGEARGRAVDAAGKVAGDQLARLRAAREAATEKLKEEATERRLNPEGLKDLAHELAEAAKSGASHSKDREPGGRPASAAPGSEASEPQPAQTGER